MQRYSKGRFSHDASHLITIFKDRAVEIIAQQMSTDMPSSFKRSFMDLSGVDMAREAAKRCYREANLTSSDVDVLEVMQGCSVIGLSGQFFPFLRRKKLHCCCHV